MLWHWDYSGDGISASGTFTTSSVAQPAGGYLITAITGTRNGDAIVRLEPAGSSIPGNEPYLLDNLVFRGAGPQLTSHGFGFATAHGSYSNPFYADFLPTPGYLEFFSTPPDHSEPPISFSAVPVAAPEPSPAGLLLMAALLLLGVWIMWRRGFLRWAR